MSKDGHIHTPFCPHGSNDALESYIEKAIQLGFTEISFTEHAPLPNGFVDPTPQQDSAMKISQLENYFAEIEKLQSQYNQDIKINRGLEVDFIEGFEQETTDFLNEYGRYLDDSILSVHFLKKGNSYACVDYSPEAFAVIAESYGGLYNVYHTYFQTVLQSIQAPLGSFKPKRIGHITLVKKFQKQFLFEENNFDEIKTILDAMALGGYELDYNGAGVQKPLCREPYPPAWVIKEARSKGIRLVYGSDAHRWKELGQGREFMIL